MSETRVSSPTLIDLLRSTLLRLEQEEGIDPQDPQLLEFKSSILRAITELEMRKADAA